MRIVDLHDIGTSLAQQRQLAAQNRHTKPRRIHCGSDRLRAIVPHPTSARPIALALARWPLILRELTCLRNSISRAINPSSFGRQPRPVTMVPRPCRPAFRPHLKAMRQFGDHADIRGAPAHSPIGDHVQSRLLLQRHRIGPPPRPITCPNRSASHWPLTHHRLAHEIRSRQRADHGPPEKSVPVVFTCLTYSNPE